MKAFTVGFYDAQLGKDGVVKNIDVLSGIITVDDRGNNPLVRRVSLGEYRHDENEGKKVWLVTDDVDAPTIDTTNMRVTDANVQWRDGGNRLTKPDVGFDGRILVRVVTTNNKFNITTAGYTNGVHKLALGWGTNATHSHNWHDVLVILEPHSAIQVEVNDVIMAVVNTGGGIAKSKDGKVLSPEVAIMTWAEWEENFQPHTMIDMTVEKSATSTGTGTTQANTPTKVKRNGLPPVTSKKTAVAKVQEASH